MSRTYLFFRPAKLPLASTELGETTVLNLEDSAKLRSDIEHAFHRVEWDSKYAATATYHEDWYEISVPDDAAKTLAIRCSLKVDHTGFVQQLCDQFGWLAFDEEPQCYQPNRPPMPA